MPPKKPIIEELRYDAQAAERGYRDTSSLRAEVRDASPPRIDVQQAAIFGLRIANEIEKPEVRARFAKLPEDLLSSAVLGRMGSASWGLWYAGAQRSTAEAKDSGARVSAATLKRAAEVKGRMMRVADYILGDDPDAGPEVASIRAGSGYADTAEDLTRLAKLYAAHAEQLEGAGTHYRPADARLAKEVAALILSELGSSDTPQIMTAKDEAARAFRVLETTYEQVRKFGVALFEDGEERFPSIYSIRPPRTSGPAAEQGGTPPAPT